MNMDQFKAFQEQLVGYSSLKSIQILSAMAYIKSECGIKDIAGLTQLSESTIHRILQDLTDCRLAVKCGKKYKLGSASRTLLCSINDTDFALDAASLEMTRLNDLTEETVHLIAIEDMDAVYIDKKEAKNQIGLRSSVGKHLPMYCSSGGKVLMAYQSEEWLELYFQKIQLVQRTENTITSQEVLRQELKKIREQGYALDNCEHNSEVVCVAAPVFFPDGRIACTIGVSVPKYRITPAKMERFIQESIRSAKEVTEKLK